MSAQFWVVTLILGIVRDIYDMTVIIARELRSHDAKLLQQQKLNGVDPENNNRHKPIKGVPRRHQAVLRSLADNKPLVLDLARNLADLVLPLEALGHIQASPGVQGLFGVISSVIGITTTWDPLLRLVPS